MNNKDINIGDRVTFFDKTSTHKKGLVIDITSKFGEMEQKINLGKTTYNFEMPKDYLVLGDDGEEYTLDMVADYLERDHQTERDIKLNNLLNNETDE